MDKRVVIFGGTGFLGMNLARYLEKKSFDIVLVSRNAPEEKQFKHVVWDGRTVGNWANQLEGAWAIVNLAGRTVDCIKTPDHKDEILRSRVESTQVIGKALETTTSKPRVWVQVSTAHIYGDPPKAICDEETPTGYGLAPTVGRAWEEMYFKVVPNGMRQVVFRTSFVMGKRGGAMKRLKTMTYMGFGGKVGHGKQGMSWIHEMDMNRLFLKGIEEEDFKGIYNATSPYPVSNGVFMFNLRKSLHMPFGIPTPAFMARVGAKYLFRTDPELALYGRYVISKRLKDQGYVFSFPKISGALKDIAMTKQHR